MLVKDNFLSQKLCDLISDDELFFPESMGDSDRIATEINSYHTEQSSCFAPYMFWDGWLNSPPNTIKKIVIQKIWEDNLPFPVSEVCGFEYWTRTFKAGQYLAPHVDEDTFLYSDSKVLSGPAIGSIYYGPDTDASNGGFLEIYPGVLADGTHMALEYQNIKPLIEDEKLRERILCKPNRLIVFDAGHVLHGTVPATSGTRYVMVINVWHKDNPPTALKDGKFFYET
jgi:hypothetical protein